MHKATRIWDPEPRQTWWGVAVAGAAPGPCWRRRIAGHGRRPRCPGASASQVAAADNAAKRDVGQPVGVVMRQRLHSLRPGAASAHRCRHNDAGAAHGGGTEGMPQVPLSLATFQACGDRHTLAASPAPAKQPPLHRRRHGRHQLSAAGQLCRYTLVLLPPVLAVRQVPTVSGQANALHNHSTMLSTCQVRSGLSTSFGCL